MGEFTDLLSDYLLPIHISLDYIVSTLQHVRAEE